MPEVNQGIINYGSIGGDASVRIVQRNQELARASRELSGAGLDPAVLGQLTALIAEMGAALRSLPPQQGTTADAIGDAVKAALRDVAAKQTDKKTLELSAKGLIEAAKGVAGVMPIAAKIAATIAAAFGFVL